MRVRNIRALLYHSRSTIHGVWQYIIWTPHRQQHPQIGDGTMKTSQVRHEGLPSYQQRICHDD